jgi:hypothetical protein
MLQPHALYSMSLLTKFMASYTPCSVFYVISNQIYGILQTPCSVFYVISNQIYSMLQNPGSVFYVISNQIYGILQNPMLCILCHL